MTTWLLLLVTATSIAGIFYVMLRMKRSLKRLNDLRVNIASDLHDEIGAALSSISFYSEACRLNLQKNNAEEVNDLLSKIGNTSRSTVDAMADIVWVIHPRNDKLEKLFERLSHFGNEILSSRGTLLRFHADPALNDRVLPVEYRKNIFLLAKECLHNIAKYAGAAEADLWVSSGHRGMKMIIRDNGRGFDTTGQSSGNGLLNMRVRAAAIKGNVLVESAPGKGTTVTFEIPYPPNW